MFALLRDAPPPMPRSRSSPPKERLFNPGTGLILPSMIGQPIAEVRFVRDAMAIDDIPGAHPRPLARHIARPDKEVPISSHKETTRSITIHKPSGYVCEPRTAMAAMLTDKAYASISATLPDSLPLSLHSVDITHPRLLSNTNTSNNTHTNADANPVTTVTTPNTNTTAISTSTSASLHGPRSAYQHSHSFLRSQRHTNPLVPAYTLHGRHLGAVTGSDRLTSSLPVHGSGQRVNMWAIAAKKKEDEWTGEEPEKGEKKGEGVQGKERQGKVKVGKEHRAYVDTVADLLRQSSGDTASQHSGVAKEEGRKGNADAVPRQFREEKVETVLIEAEDGVGEVKKMDGVSGNEDALQTQKQGSGWGSNPLRGCGKGSKLVQRREGRPSGAQWRGENIAAVLRQNIDDPQTDKHNTHTIYTTHARQSKDQHTHEVNSHPGASETSTVTTATPTGNPKGAFSGKSKCSLSQPVFSESRSLIARISGGDAPADSVSTQCRGNMRESGTGARKGHGKRMVRVATALYGANADIHTVTATVPSPASPSATAAAANMGIAGPHTSVSGADGGHTTSESNTHTHTNTADNICTNSTSSSSAPLDTHSSPALILSPPSRPASSPALPLPQPPPAIHALTHPHACPPAGRPNTVLLSSHMDPTAAVAHLRCGGTGEAEADGERDSNISHVDGKLRRMRRGKGAGLVMRIHDGEIVEESGTNTSTSTRTDTDAPSPSTPHSNITHPTRLSARPASAALPAHWHKTRSYARSQIGPGSSAKWPFVRSSDSLQRDYGELGQARVKSIAWGAGESELELGKSEGKLGDNIRTNASMSICESAGSSHSVSIHSRASFSPIGTALPTSASCSCISTSSSTLPMAASVSPSLASVGWSRPVWEVTRARADMRRAWIQRVCQGKATTTSTSTTDSTRPQSGLPRVPQEAKHTSTRPHSGLARPVEKKPMASTCKVSHPMVTRREVITVTRAGSRPSTEEAVVARRMVAELPSY